MAARILQRPLSLAMQGLLGISGQAESGTLQLVTSPNTSAVQDRVVRAAAKHGPLASEDESKLELESEHMSEVESLPFLFTEELNAMPTRPEELSPPSLREWGCTSPPNLLVDTKVFQLQMDVLLSKWLPVCLWDVRASLDPDHKTVQKQKVYLNSTESLLPVMLP